MQPVAEAMRAAEQYEEAHTGLADHEALKLRHAVRPCFEVHLSEGPMADVVCSEDHAGEASLLCIAPCPSAEVYGPSHCILLACLWLARSGSLLPSLVTQQQGHLTSISSLRALLHGIWGISAPGPLICTSNPRASVPSYFGIVQELEERGDLLCELLGERNETIDELHMDIADMKHIFHEQAGGFDAGAAMCWRQRSEVSMKWLLEQMERMRADVKACISRTEGAMQNSESQSIALVDGCRPI